MEQERDCIDVIASKPKKREEIIIEPKGGMLYAFFKRMFDIVSSFIVLSLILWFLVIIAIGVKCSTKGAVLFKDKRIGKNGKEIKVWKFRSMYKDAESNIDKYLSQEQKEIWLRERKLENDPRITRFGRFIRKTSIDELPQLFNILFGSMSVVGSRPITQRELDEHFYPSEVKVMLSSKPGLTGYWQVYGRSDVDYFSGERQKLELEYYKHRSCLFDLKLIFLTIPAVLKGKGAE